MRLAAFALLALFASAALAEPRLIATGPVPDYGNPEMSSSGQPVCVNGDWTEVAKEEISAHRAVPEVQCWRKPPCIRWSYLDRVKCTKMVKDEDYPTADPYLVVTPDMKTVRDVVEDYLVNKTIFFIGDSINGQVYQAALCEIPRWGLHLQRYTRESKAVGDDEALSARMRAYWRHHARFSQLHASTAQQFWMGDEPAELEIIHNTQTFVVPKGWHKYKPSDMAGSLSMADVVVVNYGLHYHGPPGHPELKMQEYETEMKGLFAQLDAFAAQPGRAAVFRETSAQHFIGTGSYAGIEQSHPRAGTPCVCEAMRPEVLWNNEITQLNDVVHKLAAQYPRVKVLGFYNLTAPRFDMHEEQYCGFEQMRSDKENSGSCCDCTHMCHTPQLWRHFFHQLWNALEGTNAAQPLPLRVRG